MRQQMKQDIPSFNVQELEKCKWKRQKPATANENDKRQAVRPRFHLSQGKTMHREQERVVDEIINIFQDQPRVTLRGVTGCGKTFVASNVICRLQPKAVLVMAPLKALAMQLQDSFNNDFVDANSHVFISETRKYSYRKFIEVDDTIQVIKGKRSIDEDAKKARRLAIDAVSSGDPCIVASSTCAQFSCSHLLMGDEAKPEMTHEEIDCIVSKLEAEVDLLEGKGLLSLKNRIQDDIQRFQRQGACPDMFDCYGDLLPKRLKKTLFDKMNESYGRDWLMIIDECHSTVPAMKRPNVGHVTRVTKEASKGRLRENLRQGGPLSWTAIQELMPSRVLYMSATPPCQEDLDLGPTVSLEIRPTHICDPVIQKITTKQNPFADRTRSRHDLWSLIQQIRQILRKRPPEDQAIVATIECDQADVLHSFVSVEHRCGVIHGQCTPESKKEVLNQFRKGQLDVLCGSKMVIEGLDLPGVGSILVVDANSPGFLRTEAVLSQLVGRAARHAAGTAFFLVADDRDGDVDKCIEKHGQRRIRQETYNREHGATPKSIEWAPRLDRISKYKAKSPSDNNKEIVPAYSLVQCLRILAALVQTCWVKKPEDCDDCSQEEDEMSSEKSLWWTRPSASKKCDSFYFRSCVESEEFEQMLDQLILMVTVPDIGPVRSYHLLHKFHDIETITSQSGTRLRKVVEIREVLSERLADPFTRQILNSNRRKLTMILESSEFTSSLNSELSQMFPQPKEKFDWSLCKRRLVQNSIEDETEGFVSELVCRLIDLCLIKNYMDSPSERQWAPFLDEENG